MSPPPHDRPKPAPSAARDDPSCGPTGGRLRLNSAAETLLLILLVGVFLWRGLVPGWRSLNSDFPNYYLAARLYRQGYPLERLYDLIWFQRQKDHAGIDRPIVSFIPLTPFSLLPLAPSTSLPALQAKHVWLLTNLILLLATVYLLNRMTELGARRVGILTLLAVFPLRNNLLLGQEHLLVLFLTTLAAWLYLEQRPASCGASLALGAAFKAYPALFLLYFLYKRQWRAIAGLLAGLLALGSLSIWLFGFETCRVYAMHVLPWTLRGEALDAYDVGQSSFTGLLHRLWIAEPE